MNQDVIIRDLQDWLENNLDKSLSLDEVAARSGYSKWHLQRMFRSVTGNALGSYIRTRRLSRAATELGRQDQSILDIALQSGFDSQQSFSRAFKRQFSQTPAPTGRRWLTLAIPMVNMSTADMRTRRPRTRLAVGNRSRCGNHRRLDNLEIIG
ncbi:helix-turn-helix domain-containing protein [Sodalis ligni]|nr:helix-turn-helix domain-containing protein [Sodalis ligni]